MRDSLVVAVGIMVSEDPADSASYAGEETTKRPQFGPQSPAYRGTKISRGPHSEHVFSINQSINQSIVDLYSA